MRIKLYLLESDEGYLNRLTSVFSNKFSSNLEVAGFTNKELALAALEKDRGDVFLAADVFEIDPKKLSDRTAFAYLTDSADIESVRGQNTICRFQKADLIYKEILSLYAEKSTDIIGAKVVDSRTTQIAFLSPAGGTGTTTMAMACAMHMASQNKQVLYLDFSTFGKPELILQGQGSGNFGDVLYAIKRKKSNLALKIESLVMQDPSGVYFFKSTDNALDMANLSLLEVREFLALLRSMDQYDVIVVDIPFEIRNEMLDLLGDMKRFVFILDGSENADTKFSRAWTAMKIMEDQKDFVFTPKVYVAYNRFSSKRGKEVSENVRVLGGTPRYENASPIDIVRQISNMQIFDRLLTD